MDKIAVLLCCYNRKESTIKCLSRLKNQSFNYFVDLKIFLVDDASSDGTADEVKVKFPDVQIIYGKGDLFWCRGMYLAWETALKFDDFDYFLWLNDDSFIRNDCIDIMLYCTKENYDNAIVGASLSNDNETEFTYGLRDLKDNPIIPNGKIQKGVFLNGNVVLIPKKVYQNVGLLDNRFRHTIGDTDYGLRAIKNGFIVITPHIYLGICEKNPNREFRLRKNGMCIFDRFKFLFSPLGANPFERFIFMNRHFGLYKASRFVAYLIYINLLSDRLFSRRNKNKIND
jgi:GT2 family glycosyltransferase